MKVFLCVFAVVLLTASANANMPNMPEELKAAFQACATELGLPAEKPKGPPNMDDPKVKCMHACLMKKMGSMVDGKIDAEKEVEFYKAHFPKADDAGAAKLRECVTKANEQTEECEVAGSMHQCWMETHGPMPQ